MATKKQLLNVIQTPQQTAKRCAKAIQLLNRHFNIHKLTRPAHTTFSRYAADCVPYATGDMRVSFDTNHLKTTQ